VAFAEASPFPALESLYDDVYVLDQEVSGWYSVETDDDRTGRAASADGDARAGLGTSAANDEIPQQLTEALAAGEDGHERPDEAS
jgi:hypothetical protein